MSMRERCFRSSRLAALLPDLQSPTPTHPISAAALKPIVDAKLAAGQKLQMAVVFPVSTHNYELRYWLAAAGIHPGLYTQADIGGRTDAVVELSVTPPPMMPATLEAGNNQGYCVGEPWNQQTAREIYRPDIYKQAARMLVEEGYLDEKEVPWDRDGYKAPTADFIDGITYDGRDPIGYLNAHAFGNKD